MEEFKNLIYQEKEEAVHSSVKEFSRYINNLNSKTDSVYVINAPDLLTNEYRQKQTSKSKRRIL